MRSSAFGFLSLSLLVATSACSSSKESSGFGTSKDPNEAKAPSGQFGDTGNGPNGKPTGECVKDPSFYDVPNDNCDNDGDGTVDNPPSCDTSAGSSAEDFAHALGICDEASKRGFGLVSASFSQGYNVTDAPKEEQHGVLSKFGNVLRPREGAKLGVLSTGFAQEFDSGSEPFDPGKSWWGTLGGGGAGRVPPGFPKGADGCLQSNEVNDVISLKLTLTAPKNATGFKFDFNFHSSEWPKYICSEFNDGFVAYLSAKGFNGGTPDNISFDSKKNPVSVNNGFFDRCTPGTKTGCLGGKEETSICEAGTNELEGTGFGVQSLGCGITLKKATQGGATGWLSSQASVNGGETFTLELMIWDSGDGSLDSSVLLDNFQWIGGQVVETSTERPADPK